MSSDEVVRARIDAKTKKRAAAALEGMGLTISDAIRLLMFRVAEDRRFPFDLRAPNSKTIEAIEELEAGKGKRFGSVKALLDDVDA